ncbi:peptide ABC transporter permease [Methylobacterium sp. J-068]|uniref:peptide ABC transporter permease n=1 Tax=Methylobacterium sp. J-068 TaxID=2836649 RepID=UPI001FB993D3|nr:peptide ABC transporter permease [Methylobacterium sp. J-068]MCJ2036680.1 peptide ABC transporter permease [Methylobacterium sp. J-068]
MARAPHSSVDPALDAAALLRRIGFIGLFVIMPVSAQFARRAVVVLAPIAVALLVLASIIDGKSRPVRPASTRLLRSPAFLSGCLFILWAALSLVWTPFLDLATERLLNLVATLLMTMAGYLALPDRMRSANLYLLPVGLAAASIVAIGLGLTGNGLFGRGLGALADDESILDRGLILLVLLVWPGVAWLRSRGRNAEALGLAVLVSVALIASPGPTTLVALAVGALAFALTVFRPTLGPRILAFVAASLLVLGPVLPFLARPIGATLFGGRSPGVLSLKAWQTIVTSEPVRLVTGHGFETALRGRFVNLLPMNAPRTLLFELWYELGLVGAFAAAFALRAAILRAGREVSVLVPGAMAAFAAAFLIACIGVGMMVMWWLTTLALAVLVFVAVERGQFRTRRPKASLLRPRLGG